MRKAIILPIILTAIVSGYSTYSLLDTFVIERVEGQVDFNFSSSPNNSNNSTISISNSESSSQVSNSGPNSVEQSSTIQVGPDSYFKDTPTYTDSSYADPNIYINIETYRDDKDTTTIYAAEIRLKSLSNLRTALAKNSYGRNITKKTSSMARDNNAIIAINGDYYGAQEKGYVLRNNVILRSKMRSGAEDLAIYEDGSFEIFKETKERTLESIADQGAYQVFSFGPGLLRDGEVLVDEDDEVLYSKEDNPRCAIGIVEPLHYYFVVADGRTNISKGLKLYELANELKKLGCASGYNLDGGGSATMVFNGSVVNQPTADGRTIKERSISDIVYIGT